MLGDFYFICIWCDFVRFGIKRRKKWNFNLCVFYFMWKWILYEFLVGVFFMWGIIIWGR